MLKPFNIDLPRHTASTGHLSCRSCRHCIKPLFLHFSSLKSNTFFLVIYELYFLYLQRYICTLVQFLYLYRYIYTLVYYHSLMFFWSDFVFTRVVYTFFPPLSRNPRGLFKTYPLAAVVYPSHLSTLVAYTSGRFCQWRVLRSV